MLELLIILLLWLYCFILSVMLASYVSDKRKPSRKLISEAEWPLVSILVPARNEEVNIESCLKALLELNYPVQKLQILVGNDQSTDKTQEIIQTYELKYPHIQLINIQENLGSARAKGNVLAQLIKFAKADYIFVTDADIKVGSNWVKELLPWLRETQMGIVSGTTLVKGDTLFKRWQGMEWYLGTGYIAALDVLNVPTTAVGNNMAFTRQAYEATGGYEQMPFSVTEDFQLFKAIRSKGFQSINLSTCNSVNISAAQDSIQGFLHQRKRWMIGAKGLPWYWTFIFAIQALFFPSLVAFLIIHWQLALKIWIVKILVQTVFILLMQKRLKQAPDYFAQLTLELYLIWSSFAMMLFYVSPTKMDWKGRSYNKS